MALEPRKRKTSGSAEKFLSIGLEFGLSLLFGFWIGLKADEKFGTSPWLLLLGLVVGVGAGIRLLLDRVKPTKGNDES